VGNRLKIVLSAWLIGFASTILLASCAQHKEESANLELKNQRIKTAEGKPFDSIDHMDRCIEIETQTNDLSDS
jgi:hypothetical protein